MERVSWRAVDAEGLDLATGRPPAWPGWPDPLAALAAAPVVAWPMGVAAEDGRGLTLAQALGPGGERVEGLLEALAAAPSRPIGEAGCVPERRHVAALARAAPTGTVRLPLELVGRAEGVEAAAQVDPAWLAYVDSRRLAARRALVEAGREADMEAALHVALVLATERLDPADDADVDAHVASGAQLWLLAGAVVSALAGTEPDPFAPWASLVAAGWWPIGPVGGRLVVCAA